MFESGHLSKADKCIYPKCTISVQNFMTKISYKMDTYLRLRIILSLECVRCRKFSLYSSFISKSMTPTSLKNSSTLHLFAKDNSFVNQ